MNTITINQIENTKAFQSLNPIQQSFAVKRKNRELLTNALIVHKSTGVIPGNVFGYNLAIVEEMILGESEKFQLSLAQQIQNEFDKNKDSSKENFFCKSEFKGIADPRIFNAKKDESAN